MGRIMSQADAAKFLGITPETLRRWLNAGRIPANCGRKEGRKWLLSEDALVRWVEGGDSKRGTKRRTRPAEG